MNKVIAKLVDFKVLLIVYLGVALVSCFQSYFLPAKTYEEGGHDYTHYNNYVIFQQSHFHLLNGQDLYVAYPYEYWDLYKYSPVFAMFFGMFAYLPDIVGLSLWNLLNTILLLIAIQFLPQLNTRVKGFILLTVLIELVTSTQNEQSNALIAGLIILAFGFMERKNYALGTLAIVLTVFIKLFGIVALILLIFYPKKWKTVLYTMMWFAVLFLLPLLVVSFEQFKLLYLSWMNIISSDHTASLGLSVMGWLKSWFGFEPDKTILLMVGAIILAVPIIRVKAYSEYLFRLFMLASILIWVVIFNHKSESPTFILAMTGISIWFFAQPLSKINLVLFILAFVFISLSPTDIFPPYIRNSIVIPYVLKAVPAIIIWFKIVYEMGFGDFPVKAKEVQSQGS